jgi:hypothetical protein
LRAVFYKLGTGSGFITLADLVGCGGGLRAVAGVRLAGLGEDAEADRWQTWIDARMPK